MTPREAGATVARETVALRPNLERVELETDGAAFAAAYAATPSVVDADLAFRAVLYATVETPGWRAYAKDAMDDLAAGRRP